MSRIFSYILLTQTGPTMAAQIETIQAGTGGGPDYKVHVDDMSRRRRGDHRYPARARLIAGLRHGDIVVVASPGRLGLGRADISGALQAISAKGAVVLDAGSGKRVQWTDAGGDLVRFLDRGATEQRADILRVARAAISAAGVRRAAPLKPFAVNDDRAEAVWRSRRDYSRERAAEICGVSWRTLYARFGPRSAPFGYRPKQSMGQNDA